MSEASPAHGVNAVHPVDQVLPFGQMLAVGRCNAGRFLAAMLQCV